ncbi:MAG: aminoglycoside phosphotransferase family protein [Candidatus Micrarchaeota archaeon]
MGKLPRLLIEQTAKLPFFRGEAQAEFFRKGLANIAIRAQHGGKVYLVKYAVAPASKPSVFIQADYEKRIYERVRSLGISPRIFAFGRIKISGRIFPYTIQELIDGKMPDYRRDLKKIASTLAFLHSHTRGKASITDYRMIHTHAYLENKASSKKGEKADKAVEPLLAELREEGLAYLRKHPIRKDYLCLVHNDLTQENLLISRKKCYLIDWGWAMYSSAAIDICNVLSPFTTSWTSRMILKPEDAEVFLKAYLRHFPKYEADLLLRAADAYWLSYNSMLLDWIHDDFLPSRHHSKAYFSKPDFLRKARIFINRVHCIMEK